MTAAETHPTIAVGDDAAFMEYALDQARKSPPEPENSVLSTGYSLELPRDQPGDPGTTHAEQCCFIKIANKYNPGDGPSETRIGGILPPNTALYTTMEPCNERLSGNRTCVERILQLKDKIKVVYVGIKEPGTFINKNEMQKRLEDAGVMIKFVGNKERIAQVAMAGH
ncbi:uncharacterized protein BCR38DRAFT_465204 [Pseudomassariella vexata]|uniref:CMP/dCMP-type deaminase domain-containing protein n=1 Tax=Pseudomassariella vexata TaxID=1141098 RepID=A0A1Y2E3Y2_9PEZI|nr:uncharacterized protein BCR38DRAFT_465204 [Pseudomassariella vexata]ORY66268.1 hypothetical protein BCR38DRAFT_465204 [Pseudomassariella vexata]